MPDLQVAYFPGVDLVAHGAGAETQRTYLREEINVAHRPRSSTSTGTGARSRRRPSSSSSDHGHTDVLADDRHSLDADGRDEPPALLDSLGYRLRDFSVDADSSDANVVMIYDEAVAMLTVADGSTCPAPGDVCDWTRAPRLDQDVLPLARAFQAASDADTSGVGGLSGALDLVFVRASDPSGVTSPPFAVLDGGRAVPVADYLRRTPRPDLVDLERRLGWLTDGPAGTTPATSCCSPRPGAPGPSRTGSTSARRASPGTGARPRATASSRSS